MHTSCDQAMWLSCAINKLTHDVNRLIEESKPLRGEKLLKQLDSKLEAGALRAGGVDGFTKLSLRHNPQTWPLWRDFWESPKHRRPEKLTHADTTTRSSTTKLLLRVCDGACASCLLRRRTPELQVNVRVLLAVHVPLQPPELLKRRTQQTAPRKEISAGKLENGGKKAKKAKVEDCCGSRRGRLLHVLRVFHSGHNVSKCSSLR